MDSAAEQLEVHPEDTTIQEQDIENRDGISSLEVTTVAPVVTAPPVDAPDMETLVSASSEAIKFLASIDQAVWRYVSFTDELSVLKQKPREVEAGLTPVGRYSINVEPVWFMDRDCYKVHAELKYDLPDFTSHYSLTSWLTYSLRTLKETKVLIYKNKQQLIERKADLVYSGDVANIMDSSLPYKLTYSSALTNSHAYVAGLFTPEVVSYQVVVPPGFLSEAAGLIVDRILVRRMANKSFLPENLGKLCFVIYNPTTDGIDDFVKPPQSGPPLPDFLALLAPPKPPAKKFMALANLIYSSLPNRQITSKVSENSNEMKELDLIGFERLTQPSQMDVLPIVSFSYHLLDGHLAVRLQAGSPVQMQISYAPLIVPEDQFLQPPVIPRKELDWENDAQLLSIFGERTDELKNEFMSFIRHKPELRALLADFLQALLLRKPENVIAFAAQYFSAFGSIRPLSSEVAAG